MKKKNKPNKKGLSIVSVESLCEDYFWDWMEGKRDDKIRVLRKLKVSQGTIVINSRYNLNRKIDDVKFLNSQIRQYQNNGLDLGKGDAEFGHRMPLPEPGENYRELIIFRRR